MTRQRAFTLIELVVALALMSLLATVLFAGWSFAQRSYDKVVRRGDAAWQVFASQRLIRSIVESTASGIEGDADRILVTAPAPLAVGGGLYRYEIAAHPAQVGRRDLVVSYGPARAAERTAEPLVEDVGGIEWSYLDGSSDWRTDWQQGGAAPRLLRLRVTFPPGDPRRWPDLIMAPHVAS